jgi:hypothetical protein
MIYRLMKLKFIWIMAAFMAIFMVLLVVVVSLLDRRSNDPFAITLPLWILYVVSGHKLALQNPCTVFEASLPIPTWQIFCTRVLGLVAFVWFPVLALVAAKLALGAPSASSTAEIIVESGAVITVLMLSPLCLRITKPFVSSKPGTISSVVSIFVLFSANLVLVLSHTPLLIVLVVCFLAAAALLGYARARIPASFEIVPMETGGLQQGPEQAIPHSSRRSSKRSSRTGRILVWMPIIRTLSIKSFVILIPMLPIFALIGSWAWPFLTFVFAAIFTTIHMRSLWLFTLPVSRRKLFAFVMLPLLGLLIVGCALKAAFMQHTQRMGASAPKTILIAVTAIASSSLLAVLLTNFPWWHRFGRRLRTAMPVIYLTAVVSSIAITVMRPSTIGVYKLRSGDPLAGTVVMWAARILPNNLLVLAGIAILFLAGLYWIVSKQFCELEIIPVSANSLRAATE